VLALAIWFWPVPPGSQPAWHLFLLAAAIASVLINAFTAPPPRCWPWAPSSSPGRFAEQAYSASPTQRAAGGDRLHRRQAVVKFGPRQARQPLHGQLASASRLGSPAGIVLTDAAIAPAFPSNRRAAAFYRSCSGRRGRARAEDRGRRRGYLMFCSMAGLAVSSALWMTATSANPVAVLIVQQAGLEIDFGKWLLASAVPSLIAIGLLPLIVAKLFPPRVGKTPEAPAAARRELAGMGRMSREEWITAVTFVLMVAGWIFGSKLNLNTTSVAFMGFGVLLFLGVITLDDITKQGDTLVTFFWLAVLFAMSAQLNELGFMGYVGERLASGLGGLSWTTLYVTLIVLYVLIHYMFVSQTSQVLASFGVFLDVGVKGGVLPLMAFGLLSFRAASGSPAGRQPEHHLRRQRLPRRSASKWRG
jgi:DASS family divalent anion:Na+ symporter